MVFRDECGRGCMRTALLLTMALLTVALAGCSDSGSDTPADQPVDFQEYGLEATDETGIIRGVVVDAAIVPIAGVTVTVQETGDSLVTNANGAFGFDDLDPGTYFVQAEKPGFGSVQQSVSVVAGDDEPPVLKMLMDPDPTSAPFVEYSQFNGFLVCSFTVVAASAAACGVSTPALGPVPTVDVGDIVGNQFITYVEYGRAPSWAQAEMVWDAGQELSKDLSLSFTDPGESGQNTIDQARGPSPLVVSFDDVKFHAMNLTGKTLWLRVFSTQVEGTDLVDEGTWNGPYNSSVYPVLNSTGVSGTVEDNRCIPLWGCEQSPFAEDCIHHVTLFNDCVGAGGVGAAINQGYEMFTATFFNFKPAEGWSFANDGQHPLPE